MNIERILLIFSLVSICILFYLVLKKNNIENFTQNDCAGLEKSKCWASDGKWCSNPKFPKSAIGKWQCANCSVCRDRGGTAPAKQAPPPPPKNNVVNSPISSSPNLSGLDAKTLNAIKQEINRQYNMDIEAIRNLGAISKSLLTGKNYHSTNTPTPGTLTIPANVVFEGDVKILGNTNIKNGKKIIFDGQTNSKKSELFFNNGANGLEIKQRGCDTLRLYQNSNGFDLKADHIKTTNGTPFKITNDLKVTGNAEIGAAYIGKWNKTDTNHAEFCHKDRDWINTKYAIMAKNDGSIFINSTNNKNINIRHQNGGLATISPDANLHVKGQISNDGWIQIQNKGGMETGHAYDGWDNINVQRKRTWGNSVPHGGGILKSSANHYDSGKYNGHNQAKVTWLKHKHFVNRHGDTGGTGTMFRFKKHARGSG